MYFQRSDLGEINARLKFCFMQVALGYELGPSEHLEAMKVNRHGKINEKYNEEVFLGEEIDKFEEGDMTDQEKEEELRKIVEL